ncbi:MAG: 3-dehydroquinate synthase, partial [Methanolobus sp. T82-4]
MNDKIIWIKADEGSWDERKAVVTTGMESGVDAILVDAADVEKVKELGNVKVAAFATNQIEGADIIVVGKGGEGDGTKPLPPDYGGSLDVTTALRLKERGLKVAGYVVIQNKDYENFAAEMGNVCDYLITIGTDWQVIPLENLIAGLQKKDVRLMSGVKTSEEAKLAFETMEHGTDGVLLDTKDLSQIKKTAEIVENAGIQTLPIQTAVVTRVESIGMGDRVCVDTCNLMVRGEGMLVGSQANG